MTSLGKVKVYDPRVRPGSPAARALRAPAARLDERTSIVIVDRGYDGSAELLSVFADALRRAVPGITVNLVPTVPQDRPSADQLGSMGAGCDAVLVGIGSMSKACPDVIETAATSEKALGTRAVALLSEPFHDMADFVCRERGIEPGICAFVPQRLIGASRESIAAFYASEAGRAIVGNVIGALTSAASVVGDAGAAPGSAPDEPHQRRERFLETEDRPENLQERFRACNWTDQLPVVLPTQALVRKMLKGTSRHADDVVGSFPSFLGGQGPAFTVHDVAVNAVMAGAEPEYLPVILAIAASGVSARNPSASSMAAMGLVNGPVRAELGIGSAIGAMGPYSHASATIGRSYGLLSQNLQVGGSTAGITYMGSQGNNAAFVTPIFGENEEASPWPSFSSSQGNDDHGSYVSLWYGVRGTSFGIGAREATWRSYFGRVIRGMDIYMGPLVLLDPLVASDFRRFGFQSKTELGDWLYGEARINAREFWDHPVAVSFVRPQAESGVQPWCDSLRAGSDDMVPMFARQSIHVAVVGGGTMDTWRMISGMYRGTYSIDAWR
ncbi:MAG: hypothetical protein AB7G13_30610 [Lautropia sp.]